MVLISEIGDYEDIKSALRATTKEPQTWRTRPELRNIVMSAYTIERSHWLELEGLISRARDDVVRNMLARIYLEEEVHQAMLGSLLSPKVGPWERVIGAELAYVSFVSTLAQLEPDPNVKAIFDYLLIDHLSHIKVLAEATRDLGLRQDIIEEAAKLPKGRELGDQYHLTQDLIKEPYAASADPGTKVNVRLAAMAEAIVRELVESVTVMGAPKPLAELGRQVSFIEAEHQLLLKTLINPEETVLEQAFYGELAEVTGLNRLLGLEKETGTKEVYEFMVEEDEDHLRYLGGLLAEVEGKDPSALSESKAFTGEPRRTTANYLIAVLKTSLNFRPSGRSVTKVA